MNFNGVVPRGAGGAMALPDFGRSVNPISTRGDRLWPPNYYWHPRIFRTSDSPVSSDSTTILSGSRQTVKIFGYLIYKVATRLRLNVLDRYR